MQFKSPWLSTTPPSYPCLKGDLCCETAIIGAGISGIMTLYFLLTQTQKKIALFEKDTVVSGATGYNAGLAFAHMEHPVSELLAKFSLEAIEEAFEEIDEGWEDLLAINEIIGLKDNLVMIPSATLGYDALPILIHSIEEELIQQRFGRGRFHYLVKDDPEIKSQIPQSAAHLVDYVSPEEILKILKTTDKSYLAVAKNTTVLKGGRMNSARFCIHVLKYLQQNYPERFVVYENTGIKHIDMQQTGVVLHHAQGTIQTQDLILCTNGYKNFTITDQTKILEGVSPKEAYMTAHPDPQETVYAAAFFTDAKKYPNVPYWYISYGPAIGDANQRHIILGGPEYDLNDQDQPEFIKQHAEESLNSISQFLNTTFGESPKFSFFWRGVMGYTDDGVRKVGPDKHHPHLWYNLGCNGIGIVPAISGARRIARLMSGETLPPSIFDC